MDANILELRALSEIVAAAAVCEDLYGDLGTTAALQRRSLTTIYRRLVQVLHPDKYGRAVDQAVAREAFVKATTLRTYAEEKIRDGSYGDRKPPPAAGPTIIATPRRSYAVGRAFARGDVCELFASTYHERGAEHRVVLKVVASAGDNDLVENETNVLGDLYPPGQREEKFFRYLPRLVESFLLRGDSGTERRVNVLSAHPEHVSLAEVMNAHRRGLDFRDVAWMLKRLLAALGFAHAKGIVHGAVLPPHLLVHPTDHGARLVDWCYATRDGARVRAIVKAYRAYYAPEILDKRAPTAATDLYMAAKCAVALLGGRAETNELPAHVPKPLARFLSTCLASSPSRRPDDAWALHEDLDGLLRRLVGEPKYRPLAMPARA